MEHPLRLLVVDSDLASAIDDSARRQSALQNVKAGRLELGQGQRLEPSEIGRQASFGIVVLSGFLVFELTTASGRVSADLLGPEDVIQLAGPDSESTGLAHTAAWTALTEVRLALLDAEFFARAARWPEVSAALVERAGRFGHRLALQRAVATLQSVDARLLASFWSWASQWATVAGQGVVLRVPLSHERLARLIGARRPTVTTALGRLKRAGLISQRRDGAWLLLGPPGSASDQTGASVVEMPELGDLVSDSSKVGGARDAAKHANARTLATRELQARLAEQRDTLRVAAQRHEEMLERMRSEADKLRIRRSG